MKKPWYLIILLGVLIFALGTVLPGCTPKTTSKVVETPFGQPPPDSESTGLLEAETDAYGQGGSVHLAPEKEGDLVFNEGEVPAGSTETVYGLDGQAFEAESQKEPSPLKGEAYDGPHLVEVVRYVPDIVLDIQYATTDSFTGQAVYPDARAFLIKDAVCALVKVQENLKQQGYRLKLFDAYRPLSVQKLFWKILPDPRYVANPKVGSRHNRGYAVDVSLVSLQGAEIPMPTQYDDFSERAHSNCASLPEEAIKHREVLHQAMKKHGFESLASEWWHFDYSGWEARPVLDIEFDGIPPTRCAL